MTSGPEHYRLAGEAIEISQGKVTPEQARMWLRAADIHASLARTAALIAAEASDFDEWRSIFSTAADRVAEMRRSVADLNDGLAAEPLVTCGAVHPVYGDVRCVLPADHMDGWPDPAKCTPHDDPQTVDPWWDIEHPNPAKLTMVPGDTTCGSWISGKRCMLMPGHDGDCVPYGPVFTPHEAGQLPARVPPFLAAPASLADGDLGAVTR